MSRLLLAWIAAAALLHSQSRSSDDNPGVLGVAFARAPGGVVVVGRLIDGGPAAKAGLREGDRILQVDEHAVTDARQARGWLGQLQPASSVTLRVRRDDKELEFVARATGYRDLLKRYQPRKIAVGDPAPAWFAESWDLPEGQAAPPTLAEARGKVVVLHVFQAHCPHCLSRGFPVHQKLEEAYRNSSDVVFLQVHSVFEGFDVNTPAAAVKRAREHGIRAPVLEDARMDRNRYSEIARTYALGGTPWSIVIDRRGRLTFSAFTPDEAKLRAVIERALRASAGGRK